MGDLRNRLMQRGAVKRCGGIVLIQHFNRAAGQRQNRHFNCIRAMLRQYESSPNPMPAVGEAVASALGKREKLEFSEFRNMQL